MTNAESLLDALLRLPFLDEPLASPDGAWVAWTWYRAGPHAGVYAAPVDGSAPPTCLSSGGDDVTLVSWALDSRSLIARRDHAGDERYRLVRIDLERPGVMLPLTEPDPQYFTRGGTLLPGNSAIVYSANIDIATGALTEPDIIYRHDLLGNTRTALAHPERPGSGPPLPSPQGDWVLYTRSDRHPGGAQLWLLNLASGSDREVYSAGDSAQVQGFWLNDNRVAILADAVSHRRVGLLDPPTGALRWVIDDPERNIERIIVPPGAYPRVVLVEMRGARAFCSLLDLDSGVELALPDVDGNLLPLTDCGDGWWVGEYFRADLPTDLVRFRWDDPRPEHFTSLTRVRPIPGLARGEDFRWRAPDGLEIQGWLYRAAEPRGTVIYVHGGPTWLAEDRLNAQIQYFLARGLNVLAPNYRGSTGFSLAYQEAIKAQGWGSQEQEDIRSGIEALIAAGIAAPGRLAITGTSYGGYSSWYQITHPAFASTRPDKPLLAAGAPICGMTDLIVDYETTRPDLRPYSAAMMGGTPAEVPERYRERSPLYALGNIQARLMIIQGLRDPNVTPENVHVAVAGLQRLGIEYQLLAFEDEGHGVSHPQNQGTLYRRLAEFFLEAFEE
jgi:dipeptidyl aminopeptidase/acylaminoacyl peptidase